MEEQQAADAICLLAHEVLCALEFADVFACEANGLSAGETRVLVAIEDFGNFLLESVGDVVGNLAAGNLRRRRGAGVCGRHGAVIVGGEVRGQRMLVVAYVEDAAECQGRGSCRYRTSAIFVEDQRDELYVIR